MTAFIPSSSARHHINMHPKSINHHHTFVPHPLPHQTHYHHSTTNISTQLQYSHTTTAFIAKLPINRFSYTFQLLFTFILGGLFFSTALSVVTAFFAIGKENIFRGWSLAKVCCCRDFDSVLYSAYHMFIFISYLHIICVMNDV